MGGAGQTRPRLQTISSVRVLRVFSLSGVRARTQSSQTRGKLHRDDPKARQREATQSPREFRKIDDKFNVCSIVPELRHDLESARCARRSLERLLTLSRVASSPGSPITLAKREWKDLSEISHLPVPRSSLGNGRRRFAYRCSYEEIFLRRGSYGRA